MFDEPTSFPLQFPLLITQPMIVYQEKQEGDGEWSEIKYLELQLPNRWNLAGDIVNHRSFFIFHRDIYQQLDQHQPAFRDSSQSQTIGSNEQNSNYSGRYQQLLAKQKSLYIATNYRERTEIVIYYYTDLHFCSQFKQFSKKPYQIQPPEGKNMKEYKFISFKRNTERDEILLDIVGFHQSEPKKEQILSFIIQKLLYEARYSTEGIKKQVEVQVERIFHLTLKSILRYIATALDIQDYDRLMHLAYKIFVVKREEFYNVFELPECNNNPLFCSRIRILRREITSIVYKILITEGLFPIHCEINTMNDSQVKLRLLNLIMDSEILPWSPKFHASLALGNFHYSFTPNDLFNLRTLDKRKYHKKYTYIRIRILDFFPLDTWVNLISDFYEQNLHMILKYIGDIMIQDELWKKNPECETEEDRKQTIYSNQHSKLPKTSTLKEPLLSKMKTDEAQSIKTISSNHQEGEIIEERKQNAINQHLLGLPAPYTRSKISMSLVKEFKPTLSMLPEHKNSEETEKQHQLFKGFFKRSINRVIYKQAIHGIQIENPLIQKIKTQIASEFHQTYRYELEVTNILGQFCSIITETEMRSYSTMMNNCQTPVAAFIYMICDKFRPYSESLDMKTQFLRKCREDGFPVKVQKLNAREVQLIKKSKSETKEAIENNLYRKNSSNDKDNQRQLDYSASNFHRSSHSFSSLQTDYYHNEYEFMLSNYLTYASLSNLIMMSKTFIIPAVLDQCLDYFGFYGDMMSREFLRHIQKIDGDIVGFQKQQPNNNKSFFRRFSSNFNQAELNPQLEEIVFQEQIVKNKDTFFSKYYRIMNLILKSPDRFTSVSTKCDINNLLSLIGQPQLVHQESYQDMSRIETNQNDEQAFRPIHLHYLILNFQNKLITDKQNEVKSASQRHKLMELFREACFFYYNSIRMQLAEKERRNTLSYIGFVVGKDLNTFNKEIPENVTLQHIV